MITDNKKVVHIDSAIYQIEIQIGFFSGLHQFVSALANEQELHSETVSLSLNNVRYKEPGPEDRMRYSVG